MTPSGSKANISVALSPLSIGSKKTPNAAVYSPFTPFNKAAETPW